MSGSAPVGSGSAADPTPAKPVDARVKALRRAAAVDMFDQVGLTVIPGQLWSYVDAANDPAEGVTQFLLAIGIDPDLIRARDADEAVRANDVLTLLLSVADAFDHLAPDVVRAVEARLWSGDYEQVRDAAEAVYVLARLARLEARWPGERLALLDSFLRDVAESLADPLSVTRSDLAAAERHADVLTVLAIAFEDAIGRHDAVRESLAGTWPPDWSSGLEADEYERLTGEFEALAGALLHDEALGRVHVEEVIDALRAINAALVAMLGRAEAIAAGASARDRTGAGRGKRAGTSPPSKLEAALDFFGFDHGSRPTLDAIKKRWRELARRYHPDLAGGDLAMMKTLNQQGDTLKSFFPA